MATLERVSFVFPDAGPNGEPNPAVWSKSGNIVPQGAPGVGLVISDPDNAQSLLYFHSTTFLSGANAQNSATFRATVRVPPVDNASQAWSNNHIGYRLILDDGVHRAELVLSRDGGTNQRQLRLLNSAAAAVSFPWDNDLENTYELSRLPNGQMVLTATNADPAAPNPVQTKTFALNELPASAGAPMFAFGMGTAGGGMVIWKESHAEVNSAEVFMPSFLVTSLEVRVRDVNDKVKITGTFTPAAGQNPDPSTQPVSLSLRRGSDNVAFWPANFSNPITAFTFNGTDTYTINSAEKARTGIQTFTIKKGWSFDCVDTKAALAAASYAQVLVELKIGNQSGMQLCPLVESPAGSGNWKLA